MRRRLGFFFAAFFAKGRRHLRPSSLLNAANEEILRMMSPSNGKAMTSLRSFPRLRRREEEEASAMSLRLLVIRTGIPVLVVICLNSLQLFNNHCITGLQKLKVLNLGFNNISDACLVHLRGIELYQVYWSSIRLVRAEHTERTGFPEWHVFHHTITNIDFFLCCRVFTFKPVSVDTISSIAGLTALASLNVSNSRITNAGLQHLKPLKNLRSLTLESCKVTATEIKKLQLAALPNLISVRPE
ncbi:hypothetical protein BHE74_00028378 [Ensete ventricosum]|nr:hypothetical protein BHE74_00028378 [Ensete ventricosum]